MNLQVNKTYLTKAGHLVEITEEIVKENTSHPFYGTIKNGKEIIRCAFFTKNGHYSHNNKATTFDIVNEFKQQVKL